MAHFAKLDENNNVLRVSVVNNNDIQDENGNEQEFIGISLLQNLHGADTIWKQTSYNNNFRGMYAAIGGVYDPTHDKFVPPGARLTAEGEYEQAV